MAGFIQEQVERVKRYTRSPSWYKTRRSFMLIEGNDVCAVCGKKKFILHVHHIVPFHINHLLEHVFSNLITLCPKHHLEFGHLGWWQSWNENIRKDARFWLGKLLNRPHKEKK